MNDKLSRVNAEFQDDGTPKNSATESIQHSKTSTQHSCATHALVPKLRFDEFNAVYSSYHLGDTITHKGGTALESFVEENGTHKFISIGSYSKDGKFIDNQQRISLNAKSESRLLEKNDLVMVLNDKTKTGDIIGSTILIDSSDSYIYNQRSERIITNKELLSPLYAWFLLNSPKQRKNVFSVSQGGTQIYVNFPAVKSLKIHLPALPEQEKIAAFLTAVDQRAEQLQRKKTLLQSYKKACMQRLFSNAECGMMSDEFQHDETPTSATEPIHHSKLSTQHSLRFRQDNGEPYSDWEEKKLGEIATFSKGKGISKNDVSEEGTTKCIRYGELYTVYTETISTVFSSTTLPANELVMSRANDVIIPASGETHIDIATASCVIDEGIALGGDLNIIRSNVNGVFLAYYLNNAMKHKIAGLAQGSSVIHLYASQLKDLKLQVPTKGEQTKIANFLSSIDTKIEQVTHQLTQTLTFKKGLLQQMFT
ncbi:restriction endonuclease subunit S [Rubritalea tangerina]|uniref:Restriction endonuclease subunit S n=1 Tax=Rubritalea tangerina TaxID=430798 RepID=A0ABW4Z7G0_9BACT